MSYYQEEETRLASASVFFFIIYQHQLWVQLMSSVGSFWSFSNNPIVAI